MDREMFAKDAQPQPETLRADEEFVVSRGRSGTEQISVLTVSAASHDPLQHLTEQVHGTLVVKRDAGTTFTIAFNEAGAGKVKNDPI
jgi:hypothetical protein